MGLRILNILKASLGLKYLTYCCILDILFLKEFLRHNISSGQEKPDGHENIIVFKTHKRCLQGILKTFILSILIGLFPHNSTKMISSFFGFLFEFKI